MSLSRACRLKLGDFVTLNYRNKTFERLEKHIVIGIKTTEELCSLLKQRFSTVEEDLNAINQTFLECNIRTALFAITNDKNLHEEDLEFLAFRIVRDHKSRDYYYQHDREYTGYWTTEIYVLIERQSGYIYSNCNKLLLELLIAKGIDKADILEKNNKLDAYLSYLHLYFEEESGQGGGSSALT